MRSKRGFCDELHPRFSGDFKRLDSVVEARLFLFFSTRLYLFFHLFFHKVNSMEVASNGFFNDQRIQIQATFLSHQSYIYAFFLVRNHTQQKFSEVQKKWSVVKFLI